MPKSKSKRRRYQPPPKPRPKPSPRWVPVLFFSLLGTGFAVIIGRYAFSEALPKIFNHDPLLWVGLALIAVAFGVATQWR